MPKFDNAYFRYNCLEESRSEAWCIGGGCFIEWSGIGIEGSINIRGACLIKWRGVGTKRSSIFLRGGTFH